MLIRLFQESDAPVLRQLYHDTIHAINARDYTQKQLNIWAPESYNHNEWLNSFKDNICFVAEISSKIVGFADITPSGYLERLFVHKDYQGQGVGKALMQALVQKITQLKGSEMMTQASITAKPFFERYGFVVIEEQRETHQGIVFVNYLMHKSLV